MGWIERHHKRPARPKPDYSRFDKVISRGFVLPYTEKEKLWLKETWEKEYFFLRDHGLSHLNRRDRIIGRLLVREMIEEETENESNSSDEWDDFRRELEDEPMSHLADGYFSIEELEWVKKYYRHTGFFLQCYGLKPYRKEDCQEGASIVRMWIREDESEKKVAKTHSVRVPAFGQL